MKLNFNPYSILFVLTATLLMMPGLVSAQSAGNDTLRLTIPKAEEIFLQKNLILLANQYNIDINKALVQQAKVWDNPVLNTDQNIYDGKFFRHTTENGQQYGQVYIQVQQLIRTAGKIKKQTQLAQDNVLSAQAQFNDVMRNLKYVLTTDMNNLAQLQNVASVYKNEMQTMQALVKGMDEMLKLGDISQKENVRIKALLFSLQSDFNDNLRQQYDIQKEIAELLQLNEGAWVMADAGQSFSNKQISDLIIATLQDSALQNRPDLAFAKTQSVFQQHNILYQKALAKPDVTVGVEYDQNSSYTRNLYGLGISLPLPLFNKNKGNIAAAQFAYKQSSTVVQQVQSQVSKEVTGAWQKLNNATSMLNSDNTQLQDNYETLMKNMVDSYKQRQVSLVEFIDFFDAYKDTRIKQWQQVTNQRNAAAELNFTTNQNIVKL
jgi:cobalt-zinc-cadmium efflux system outer membrane protein